MYRKVSIDTVQYITIEVIKTVITNQIRCNQLHISGATVAKTLLQVIEKWKFIYVKETYIR